MAYVLSKFSSEPYIGPTRDSITREIRFDIKINPISGIFRRIFQKKSEKYLASISDTGYSTKAEELVVPFDGIVKNDLFEHTTGSFTTRFYSEKCRFRGTQVAVLVNPTLSKNSTSHQVCDFTVRAPLYRGKYPSLWMFDTTSANDSLVQQTTLLLCSEISIISDNVLLKNIPPIIKRPAKRCRFSVYHATHTETGDTLTFTYCIRFTDRTSSLVHCQINFGRVDSTPALGKDTKFFNTIPRFHVNAAGERCCIIDVNIKAEKDIFRVDAFVHSKRQNQVVGWGVTSSPG